MRRRRRRPQSWCEGRTQILIVASGGFSQRKLDPRRREGELIDGEEGDV